MATAKLRQAWRRASGAEPGVGGGARPVPEPRPPVGGEIAHRADLSRCSTRTLVPGLGWCCRPPGHRRSPEDALVGASTGWTDNCSIRRTAMRRWRRCPAHRPRRDWSTSEVRRAPRSRRGTTAAAVPGPPSPRVSTRSGWLRRSTRGRPNAPRRTPVGAAKNNSRIDSLGGVGCGNQRCPPSIGAAAGASQVSRSRRSL
jgi:hypothetical protein